MANVRSTRQSQVLYQHQGQVASILFYVYEGLHTLLLYIYYITFSVIVHDIHMFVVDCVRW